MLMLGTCHVLGEVRRLLSRVFNSLKGDNKPLLGPESQEMVIGFNRFFPMLNFVQLFL